MKIKLQIKTLITTNLLLKKLFLKIHLDEKFKIESAQKQCHNGVFIFMQKNTLYLDRDPPKYVSFSLFSQTTIIARISVFCSTALQQNTIMLKPIDESDKNTYQLQYQLQIAQIKKSSNNLHYQAPLQIKKAKKTSQQPTDQIKKSVKYLQLSRVTYNFGKKLGPVIRIFNQMKKLNQSPQIAFFVGIVLTLVVLFPKISIFVMSICLMFGRQYIITYIQNINLQRNTAAELILVPQQNLNFLKDQMQFYISTYQNIREYLREDDRTKIINIIQIICKLGFLIIILDVIFSLQTIIIMLIWTIVLSFTQTGRKYEKLIFQYMLIYNRKMNKIIKNVKKNPYVQVIKPLQATQIMKQFYIFEHQRWWVGTEWGKRKWSDQKGKLTLQVQMEAPIGWTWVDDWKIQHNKFTDSQGFQYADGIFDMLNPKYGQKDMKSTIRRRKWTRTCKKTAKFQDLTGSNAKQPNTSVTQKMKIQ